MQSNKISVVLAVYNGEKYLHQLLASIVDQKHINLYEIIVVNDCSKDNSLSIIKEFQQQFSYIKIINNNINSGPVYSFLTGIKHANGDFIALADQDDIWLDDKLFFSLNLILKADLNKPAVAFTDLTLINEKGNIVNESFWYLYKIDPLKNNFYTILFGNIITGCATLFNKKMQAELVEMPVDVKMHDHWIALIAYSFGNYVFSTEKKILYRVHENSVTEKKQNSIKDTLSNFIKTALSNDSKYLKENFNQAELFYAKYVQKLEDKHIRQLNGFIKLKKSSGLVKKLKSKFRFL